MSILLAKNLREILKTWRIWVLIFVMVIAAISGPMFAKYAGKLLSAFGGDLMFGSLPEATAMTASQQWVSDLGQSVTIAIALIAGTMMAGELSDESYFSPSLEALAVELLYYPSFMPYMVCFWLC